MSFNVLRRVDFPYLNLERPIGMESKVGIDFRNQLVKKPYSKISSLFDLPNLVRFAYLKGLNLDFGVLIRIRSKIR